MPNKQRDLPTIVPHFPLPAHSGALSQHIEKGEELLRHLLPKNLLAFSPEKIQKWTQSKLPLIKWSEPSSTPNSLSIYFLCTPKQEVKGEKVLLEVIQKWLIPEKEVQVLGFYNLYFYMREIKSQLFFLAEVQIFVEDTTELRIIQENLPLLCNELTLSLSSSKYLEEILDTKALSYDQKSSQIQQYLRRLHERAPKQFGIELFREMSTFLALANPNFHKFRLSKHLAKIVASHYLMTKRLNHGYSISPEKRHLEFRFIRSKLHFPFGVKSILGFSIGVCLTDRYEAFEDMHVISGVQKFIPEAQIVKGSYYTHRVNNSPLKYLYLELEKKDGTRFSPKEIQKLNAELKEELKNRIERLIPSVFMIRNEEEVMRNILLLSQELKYLADLPQVMVNFDKQGANELYFTILVIRILRKHDVPLDKAFGKVKGSFRFIPDRVQNVGYIRKKNPKEANVFHLCIPKDHSISRTDSSVNFYLARQKIISIITEALGEVRDYNGGMILKQGELFSQLKHAFSGVENSWRELLENFFFSLNPIEAQATASLKSLITLFKLFLKSLKAELPKRESCFLKFLERENIIFAVLRNKDSSLNSLINEELNQLDNFSKLLIRTKVFIQGTLLQGFIYETTSSNQKKQFQSCINRAVERWKSQIVSLQEVHLSFIDFPPSLDPRLGGDEISNTLMKMLFEGLTRFSSSGGPALALAKSVDISADQKQYTFKLRTSYWSNQTRLVAQDFEYAWKKVLSPSFYTPFAYFFYPIKNAKAAKEGKVEIDQVGVKAVDDSTLVVDLETPTPEFLEITGNVLYSPVNQKLEKLHPNWFQGSEEGYVCNGPFKLKKMLSNGGYELIKNPYYWDRNKVKLDRIHIGKNQPEVIYEMFKNDEIDWVGRPMLPWEQHFEKGDNDVVLESAAGVNWCVFNTQRFPFNNLKIRQAFAYVLDRKKLVEQFPGNCLPAVSPVPLQHSTIDYVDFLSGDKELAIRLFHEGLKELNLTAKEFPFLPLFSGKSNGMLFELIVKQWKEAFGVSCSLETYEFHVLFSKMIKGEFQCAVMFWKAWINDPTYTLNLLENRSSKVNFSKWENLKYQQLLEAAKKEVVLEKRMLLLQQAEKVLIEECPVTSVSSIPTISMYKKRLKNVLISEVGIVDFKYASIVAPERAIE